MPRNACTRHPRKDVIEIPEGSRYCKRCHHLVPPVEEVALEAEPEPSKSKDTIVTELTESGASFATIAKIAKKLTKQPVEAKPTEETEALENAIEEAEMAFDDAIPDAEEAPEETPVGAALTGDTQNFVEMPAETEPEPSESVGEERIRVLEQTKKIAEIARLKALLAKLEPETE